MRNILFLGGLGCGGAENQMSAIASLLSQRGNNVYFIYTGNDKHCSAILGTSKVQLIKMKVPELCVCLKIAPIYILLKVYSFIRKEKINTVIAFLDIWNFIACVVSVISRKRVRAIVGVRNARHNTYTTIKGKLFNSLNKYSSAVVSNSYNGVEVYKKYLPYSNINFQVIYNIVKPLNVSSSYSVRRNDKLTICIPASYREVKNPYRLIDAVHALNSCEQHQLKILWFGRISSRDSEVYDKMSTMLKSYGLQECFSLYDARENIADIMYESDFIGLFSTSEGLPNSICEAMYLGKPVIMSRMSDYEILIDEAISGYTCDPYDINDIVDVLRKCIRLTSEQIQVMGYAAKKKAATLLSETAVIERWENLL